MAKDFALTFNEDDHLYQERDYQGAQEAERLVQLAKLEPRTDGGLRTAQLLSQVLAKVPHHHEGQILLDRLHQMLVPRWHLPMLADKLRNRAYAAAIAAKVRPGDVHWLRRGPDGNFGGTRRCETCLYLRATAPDRARYLQSREAF